MAQPAFAPSSQRNHDHDHIVLLQGVTWADFERIREIRGENARPRLTYLEGTLELMTTSKPHEQLRSWLARLVETWCLENDVDISAYGEWTQSKPGVERSAQPDECFVLGNDEHASRPDIAIEVVWTSGGIDKLDVYRKLDIPEVWIWQRGALTVHVLRGQRYQAVARSELLPDLDLEQLVGFLDVHPMTQAVKRYRAALAAGE